MFHCVCLCLLCIINTLLSCISDFIQFIFIRAVFSAVFSLTILSVLLFLLIDFFLCCCPWQIEIHSFILLQQTIAYRASHLGLMCSLQRARVIFYVLHIYSSLFLDKPRDACWRIVHRLVNNGCMFLLLLLQPFLWVLVAYELKW